MQVSKSIAPLIMLVTATLTACSSTPVQTTYQQPQKSNASNINQLKVDTIKTMYSQTEYGKNGEWQKNWTGNAPSDVELLHQYGNTYLRSSIDMFTKETMSINGIGLECVENTFPSLFVYEYNILDIADRVWLDKIFVRNDGKVQANTKVQSMQTGEVFSFEHSYEMSCNNIHCQITNVYSGDSDQSLVSTILNYCQ